MEILRQLTLLGIVCLLLVFMAIIVVKVHHVVRFESGLDNNETLRRMWSKSDLILFQRVKFPVLHGALIGTGVGLVLREILIGIIQVFDIARHPTPVMDYILTVIACAVSASVSSLLYRMGGGDSRLKNIAATLAFALVVFATQLYSERDLEGIGALALVFWLLSIVGTSVGSVLWMSSHRIGLIAPQTPEFGFPYLQLLLYVLPLWAVRVVDFILHLRLASLVKDNYLAKVADHFSEILVLVSCAFAGILAANKLVMKGDFYWQWPTVLIPLISMEIAEFAVSMFTLAHSQTTSQEVLMRLVTRSLIFAATGYIGAVTYVAIVARYAAKALDPGVDGQSELIISDDDDSEFEV